MIEIQTLEIKKEILINYLQKVKNEKGKIDGIYTYSSLEKKSGLTRSSISSDATGSLKQIASNFEVEFEVKLSEEDKINIINKNIQSIDLSIEHSYDGLSKKFGFAKDSIRTSQKLIKLLDNYGITFVKKQTHSEKLSLLNNYIKELKASPKTIKKEYAMSDFDKGANLTENSVSKSKALQNLIISNGLKIKEIINLTPKQKKEKLTNFLNNLDKDSPLIKEFQLQKYIAQLAGIRASDFRLYPELKLLALKKGIKFKIDKRIEDYWCTVLEDYLKANKDNLEELFKDLTNKKIEEKIGIPEDTLKSKKARDFLDNFGFISQRKKTLNERLQKAQKIIDYILSDNIRKSKTYRLVELNKMCEFRKGTISKNSIILNMFIGSGIVIESHHTYSASKNVLYIIDKLKESNHKVINTDAILEYSKDIHNIQIAVFSEATASYLKNTFDIFSKENREYYCEIVKDIMVNLTHIDEATPNDISLQEIKLHILNAYDLYVNEQELISILEEMEINIAELIKDNILKRIRYAKLLTNSNIVEIEYKNKLHQINTSTNIIISKGIKNTDALVKQWKEYVEYLINNNLAGYIKKGLHHQKRSLEEHLSLHPEYSKAFFLDDDLKTIKELGYEGLAALAFTAMNKSQSDSTKRTLSKIYHSTNARCSGFFMYLATKGLALSQSKYITIFGGTLIIDIIGELSKNHIGYAIYEKAINNDELPKKSKTSLSNKSVLNHLNYLCFSILPNIDAMLLTRSDFEDYIEVTEFHTNVSGSISHKSFIELTFSYYGNKMAFLQKKQISNKEYFHNKLLEKNLSEETLINYNILISDIERIIAEREINEQISTKYIHSHIKTYANLLAFLDILNTRLTRKEFINIFNPAFESKDDFRTYYVNEFSESAYHSAGSFLLLLFKETRDKEYYGAYSDKWHSTRKNNKVLTKKRNGLDRLVYETLQSVAFNTPAPNKNYPFIKNSKDGSILDTSWWKHDTSPVIAIALWLATKLPRRGLHILNLDVNDFLVYEDVIGIDGKTDRVLSGFYFNTDKNRNISKVKKDIISIRLLRKIFKPIELELIENYVQYVKDAYDFMPEVEYTSGGGYKKIKPLFPNNEYNGTIPKNHLDIQYNKTLLMTQFRVRELASQGVFDNEFNIHERENRVRELKECTLLFNKEEQEYKHIPVSYEELIELNYAESSYIKFFTSIDGLHNLRGAGATYLLKTVKMSIEDITFVTGHTNDKILQTIYLHINETDLIRIVDETMVDLNILKEGISKLSDSSSRLSTDFIDKVVMPLINNTEECSQKILKKLEENGFMCQDITIISDDKNIYGDIGEILVNNGLKIASKFHPIGNWDVYPFGICTLKDRCPRGTAGICSKCPHLLFNAFNIEGVIFKVNESMLELAHLQTLLSKAYKCGTLESRQSIKKEHTQKFEEWVGWIQILQIIEDDITERINKNNKNLPAISSIVTSKISSIRDLQMDIISDARKMNIENITTTNIINDISNQLLINSLKKGDLKTSEKIAYDGVDWFIGLYSNLDVQRREELVNEYLIELDENIYKFSLKNSKKEIGYLNHNK